MTPATSTSSFEKVRLTGTSTKNTSPTSNGTGTSTFEKVPVTGTSNENTYPSGTATGIFGHGNGGEMEYDYNLLVYIT